MADKAPEQESRAPSTLIRERVDAMIEQAIGLGLAQQARERAEVAALFHPRHDETLVWLDRRLREDGALEYRILIFSATLEESGYRETGLENCYTWLGSPRNAEENSRILRNSDGEYTRGEPLRQFGELQMILDQELEALTIETILEP